MTHIIGHLGQTEEQRKASFEGAGLSTPASPISVQDLETQQTPINVPELTGSPSEGEINAVAEGAIAGAEFKEEFTTPSGAIVDGQGNIIKEAPQQTGSTAITDRINKAFGQLEAPTSLVEQRQQLFEQEGFLEKQKVQSAAKKKVASLTAQRQALQLEAQATSARIQEQFQGRGATRGGVAPHTASELRKIALRQLPITQDLLIATAELAIANGDINTAISNIDNLMDLMEKDRTAMQDFRTAQLDAITDIVEGEDKKRLEEAKAKALVEKQEADNFFDLKKEFVKQALESGDAQLAGEIAKTTDQEELSRLTGQITSGLGGDQFTLGKEQIRFDAQGNIIARGVSDTTGVGGFASSVEGWASILEKGQGTIANVPQGIRNKVVDYLNTNDVDIRRQLSDGAIKDITQSESAINNLRDLRKVIQSNLQFIGPIAGLSRFNPWSDARKAQADIDRVRQTVGKALEGGVLRKEDEVKYKKILATLADTPETALYKIDALISTISRDVQNFKEAQAGAGRFIEGAEESTLSTEGARAKYNY